MLVILNCFFFFFCYPQFILNLLLYHDQVDPLIDGCANALLALILCDQVNNDKTMFIVYLLYSAKDNRDAFFLLLLLLIANCYSL